MNLLQGFNKFTLNEKDMEPVYDFLVPKYENNPDPGD